MHARLNTCKIIVYFYFDFLWYSPQIIVMTKKPVDKRLKNNAQGLQARSDASKDGGPRLLEFDWWKTALANAPSFISVVDRNGIIQYVNRMLPGFGKKNIIGTSIFKYQTDENRHISRKTLDGIFRSGKRGIFEAAGVGAHDSSSWYQVQYGPIERDGEVKAAIFIAIDISDRKKAEKAISYRIQFEKLIMNISSRFVRLSLDEIDAGINDALRIIGEFAHVDRAYVFQFREGLEADNTHEWCAENIQAQIQKLKHINMSDEFPWFLLKMRARLPIHIRSMDDLPGEAIREKGHFERHGIRSVMAVPMLGGEKLTGFLGFDAVTAQKSWSEDLIGLLTITADVISNALERKRRDQELRASEEKFRFLVNFSPDPIAITRDGQYRQINLAFTEMLGYTQQDVDEGLMISDLVQDKDKETILKRHRDRLSGKNVSKTFRIDYIAKNGKLISCETSAVMIPYGGRPAALVIIRDITERINAERENIRLQNQLNQAQRMEAIGTLAGGIAHDINSILYGIIGYAEIARYHQIEEGHPALLSLDEIIKASDRAANLVKQILTFSRRKRHEKIKFKLTTIINETLGLLRPTMPPSIEIKEQIKTNADFILADPGEIHQVMMNLCTNAAYAMRDTGGTLMIDLDSRQLNDEDIALYPGLNPGPYLVLTVSDNGHGIDHAIIERIFDPYFTTKPAGEGTGLGLAVVHGIVKACGGAISVESEPGKGASFEILLPLFQDENVNVPFRDG
ncbi:putative Histidine kinase [uncultured Desulfobacterium sp.]|uniref:histidine kinase n=1 Tax=uncultured Desulfobacterium sp. TaxID=201089 RepID=A0A445MYN0_9BACT|nr:putative Histidine kinase [uncultured Desulfobacterium sp.]